VGVPSFGVVADQPPEDLAAARRFVRPGRVVLQDFAFEGVNHPRLRTFRESRRSGLHITRIMPVVARASLLDTSTVPYHAALMPVFARSARVDNYPRLVDMVAVPAVGVRSSGGWCVIDDARG
jgi:hypothetical protein